MQPVQCTNVMSNGTASSKHPFVVILNAVQARSIYMLRSTSSAAPEMQSVAGKSTIVAELYRVSPKTIRDIWNRKTWTQVTFFTWFNSWRAQCVQKP